MRTSAIGLGALAEEDETGTRTAQCLVRGSGNNVAVLEGIVALLRGHQSADVCNVCHQIRVLFVCDLPLALVASHGIALGTN